MSGWSPWEQTPPIESVRVLGVDLRCGDQVILRPNAGGDIMDLALAGKIAIIEAIERDFEDRTHIAVIVADDPGRDLGLLRQPGHRFFFSPEELEPLSADSGSGQPNE